MDETTLHTWADFGTAIGGVATAIGVRIALIAAKIAYDQFLDSKENQQEATAQQIYSNYLALAIEYPAFTQGKQPNEPFQSEQYQWFVSYMLVACEHILDLFPEDPEWIQCIEGKIEYYNGYLCNDKGFNDNDIHYYCPEIRSLINKSCGAANDR
jgi:hypothetical protein